MRTKRRSRSSRPCRLLLRAIDSEKGLRLGLAHPVIRLVEGEGGDQVKLFTGRLELVPEQFIEQTRELAQGLFQFRGWDIEFGQTPAVFLHLIEEGGQAAQP